MSSAFFEFELHSVSFDDVAVNNLSSWWLNQWVRCNNRRCSVSGFEIYKDIKWHFMIVIQYNLNVPMDYNDAVATVL